MGTSFSPNPISCFFTSPKAASKIPTKSRLFSAPTFSGLIRKTHLDGNKLYIVLTSLGKMRQRMAWFQKGYTPEGVSGFLRLKDPNHIAQASSAGPTAFRRLSPPAQPPPPSAPPEAARSGRLRPNDVRNSELDWVVWRLGLPSWSMFLTHEICPVSPKEFTVSRS